MGTIAAIVIFVGHMSVVAGLWPVHVVLTYNTIARYCFLTTLIPALDFGSCPVLAIEELSPNQTGSRFRSLETICFLISSIKKV